MRLPKYWKIGLCVAGGLFFLALANVHLVYIAVTSQPDCVEHQRSIDRNETTFRAAKSSC
jgi:hypothetical protein